MTKEKFYKIIVKPKAECDGCELHLKDLWNGNNAKGIFTVTGLDFTETFAGRPVTSGMQIKKPPPIQYTHPCYDEITVSVKKKRKPNFWSNFLNIIFNNDVL